MIFPRENMIYRVRHCPPKEKLRCLIPAPNGYTSPFPWPKSCDYVYYSNVPSKSLAVEKANQNRVQFQGNVFYFPRGGSMFPQEGADVYIDELARVISIADGSLRTQPWTLAVGVAKRREILWQDARVRAVSSRALLCIVISAS